MKTLFAISLLFVSLSANARNIEREFEKWLTTLPEANADWGAYPDNYEEVIKGYFAASLKDPSSVIYNAISKPQKEFTIKGRVPVDPKNEALYGYSSCVSFNAKNSYGGYVGNRIFWFLIHNGEIVNVIDTSTGRNFIFVGRPITCGVH